MHIFRWACFIFVNISHLLLSSHYIPFIIYPSMWSVLSTIIQKGGDCWCNICLPCVLEIVDRNRHGLICLLVHTERNIQYRTEEECYIWCQVRGTSPKSSISIHHVPHKRKAIFTMCSMVSNVFTKFWTWTFNTKIIQDSKTWLTCF